MRERRHFNYGILVKITAFVIIPAVLISALLIYVRMYGIREALQELVRTETDNRYALSIGKTDIHLRSLSFKFHNVRITRDENDTTSGVSRAEVPEFELRFGSVATLFSKELDISLLSVIEPKITILPGRRQIERSMITRELIDLYPVIEAILAGFNIQSLNVSRATLHFVQNDNDIFSIRFVDLNIRDWRMRDLSNSSQLRIAIEKQNLNLGKANLNFSGIEYNYLEHHLVFTDFSLSAADSASGSNISISGKALKLSHLDYRELYNNLRANLKRAEIVEPVINAKFQWKKGRRAREINRNIVTRMVQQTIGECELDSAIITKARVHIELRHAEDTVSINLPRVDFRLHTFAVVKDSANFQIGEMQVNLNGSALSLPDNWSVELDEVLYDHHRDLTLHNIVIRNAQVSNPIATLSTLRVRYFNLIALIFQQRFSAWTIYAEGGHVDLHHFARKTPDADSASRAPDIAAHSIALKDISLAYQTRKTSIEIDGLSFRATNIRTDEFGSLRYQVKSVSAKAARFGDSETGLQATMNNLAFSGEKLNVHRVSAIKDSLTVVAENLETEIAGTVYKIRSLKYVSADRVLLTGRVPGATSSAYQKKRDPFAIGRVDFKTVQAKLITEGNLVSFNGRNVYADRFQIAETFVWPRHVYGELSDLSIRTPKVDAHVAQLLIEYPRRVTGTEMRLSGPKFTVAAHTITVRKPEHQSNWTLERLSLTQARLSSEARTLVADSITVASAMFGSGDSHADRVDVYKPHISLGQSPATTNGQRASLLGALPARHVYLHPGEITLADNHRVAFGLLHADREKNSMRASYISTALKKSDLTARNIFIEPNRITFDSILIIPNQKWYASLNVEETQILARFSKVTVREFSLDHYAGHRSFKDLAMEIGYADFDLRRNKMLPDPPPDKKPVTLDGLIPLPGNVQVSTLNIRDGRIQYRQISDKTGEEGYIMMDKIVATSRFDSLSSFISLNARTNLYQSGVVELDYKTLAKDKFRLDIHVQDVDLTKLNQIIMPLQSLRIKSGYLKEYRLSVHADDDVATGDALISYEGLHLELFKHDEPERKSLGTEVLTLLADGIILKHSKENARSPVSHPRVKHKSVFHYWVTSAIQGATGAIRKGKKRK